MAAFPTDPLGVRLRYALNADLTADPSTWTWVDFTTDVDFTFDITSKIGAQDDAGETNSELSFHVRNNDGKYTIDHPESTLWPYWREGVPIEYSWDLGDGAGWRIQEIAYLGASIIVWTANTPYRCVSEITAAGHFRRLGRDPALASALRRSIPASRRRKAFWPMEDAAGARQAASYYPAVPPLAAPGPSSTPEFGTASLVPGAFSVATFRPGDCLFASLPSPTASQTVRFSCLLYTATIQPATVELFELRAAGGTIGRYVVEASPNALRFRAYTNAGVEVSGSVAIGFTAQQTDLCYFELDLQQTAAGTITWTMRTTTWRFDVNGLPVGATASAGTTFSGTLGGITGVGLAPTSLLDDVQMGMAAVTEAPLPTFGGLAAVLGWPGNNATGRVAGMCDEFSVPRSVTSTTLGVVMGPQIPGSLLDNLRNAQNTDHGILTDHMGVVSYTALSELYNLAPALTLSATVRGQLGALDDVKRDDQRKVNIASASRPGGSTATLADEDDVRMSGRFEGSAIEVNVAKDADLPSHAGWALALGTQRGYDFRQLALRPHLAPALAVQMATLTLGGRVSITSLPPQMPKGGLERIVRGRTTVLPGRAPRRVIEITVDLVPTSVYDAFVLDSDRLDTPGTEVIVAASAAATVVTTQTTDTPATATGATSIPLWVAGEKVTLTAVAGEILEDAFTRSVSSGWGSMPASTSVPAQAWTPVLSVAPAAITDFFVTGTAAAMNLQAAGSQLRATLNSLPLLNPNLVINTAMSVVPTGDAIFTGLQYRRGAGASSDCYDVQIYIPTSAVPILRLYAPGGGLIAEVVLSAITHTAGLVYFIQILPIGIRHRVRVWTAATGQPSYWQVDVVDTARVVPGPIGTRAGRTAGNTNAGAISVTFDNLSFAGVQRFTLTRGMNGFSKTLPIGSQVKLWQGRGMGL